MKHRFLAGVALGAALGLSLGALGVFSLIQAFDHGDEPRVVVVPREEATHARPDGADEGACEVDRESLHTCEDALARLKVAYNRAGHDGSDQEGMVDALEEMLVKSGGAAPDGTPMDFPTWLPRQFTPQGFEQAVDEIKRTCPEVIPKDAAVSCDEFPCLLTAEVKTMPSWNALRQCDAWSRYFGNDMGLKTQRVSAPGQEDVFAVSILPGPRDDEDEVQRYLEEYEGNLEKRSKHRRDDFYIESVVNRNRAACEEDRDPSACFTIGSALRERDPEQAHSYLVSSCEGGNPNACNNAAWFRCHDDGQCDDEALTYARQAAELQPWDGQGALDTLAYILCQKGQPQEANVYYQRSCEAGYRQNCTKLCGGS